MSLDLPPYIWSPPAIERAAPDIKIPTWKSVKRAIKYASFLPGWFPAAVGGGTEEFDINFLGSGVDAATKSSWTFTVGTGNPSPTRQIIIAVAINSSTSSTPSFSAITLGGVTGVEVVTATTSRTLDGPASLYTFAVPTGTSSTLSITTSISCVQLGFAVWRMVNGDPNAMATATDTTVSSNAMSASLAIGTDEIGIGYAFSLGSTALRTWSWTNMTEDMDQTVDAPEFASHSASTNKVAGTSTRTATASSTLNTGDTLTALLLASFASITPDISTNKFYFIDSVTSESANIVAPGSGIQDGDFLVIVDAAHGSAAAPSAVAPGGFTIAGSSITSGNTRMLVWYRIANGSENGLAFTGMNGNAGAAPINQKVFLHYRAGTPLTAISVSTPVTQATTGDQTTQTINASAAGTGPVIAVCAYAEMLVGGVLSQTSTRLQDHEITPNGSITALWVRDFIQNFAIPHNFSFDMGDEGTNLMFGCYFYNPIFAPVVELSYIGNKTDAGDTPYNFGNFDLGTGTCICVVGVMALLTDPSYLITSCTIGGITATLATTASATGFAYRQVNGGGIVNVSAVWAGSGYENAVCHVWALRTVAPSPYDAISSSSGNVGSGTSPSIPIDTPALGIAAFVAFTDFSSITWSGTGVTEVAEPTVESTHYSAAQISPPSSLQTNLSVQINHSADYDAMSGISFEPPKTNLTYLTSAVSTTDAATYTFSSQSFGVANPTRCIVVAISNYNDTAYRTVSSVTVGGIAATLLVGDQVRNGGGNDYTVGALYIAAVPTGTTGSVVVTFSGTASRCGIGLWRLVNTNIYSYQTDHFIFDDAGTIGSPFSESLSLTVPNSGCGIFYSWLADINGAPRTATWSQATERFDATLEGNSTHTGADIATPGTASRQVTWNNNNYAVVGILGATFGPATVWPTLGVDLTFTASAVSPTQTTSASFTSISLGADSPDRVTAVCVYGGQDSSVTFTGCTIGGVAATKAIEQMGTGNWSGCAIYVLATGGMGTTATIAYTVSNNDAGTGIAVFRIINAQNVMPNNTASDGSLSGTALSTSLTIPLGGAGFGYSCSEDSVATWSWTNMTEVMDQTILTSDRTHSAAISSTAGTSTRTATASSSLASGALVMASWSPKVGI